MTDSIPPSVSLRFQPAEHSNGPLAGDFSQQQIAAAAESTPAIVGPLAPSVAPLAAREIDVLVVEDNHVNQIVVRQMLTSQGFTSEVAGHGQKAIDVLTQRRYGLILMDGHMPVMDGLKATAEICQMQQDGLLPENPHVSVVALTANASSDSQNAFKEAGAADFLSKPVTLVRLQAVLKQFISLQQKPAETEQVESQSSEQTEPAAKIRINTSELFDSVGFNQRCGTDHEFKQQVLELMRGSMVDTLQQLDAARIAGDFERLKGASHRLKGAAGDCALVAVSKAAATLESAADQQMPDEISASFDDLENRIDETLSYLDELLLELSTETVDAT